MNDYENYKIKIHLENEANRILNLLIPKCNEILKSYVGKKVLKVDFRILKELDEQFKPLFEEFNKTEIKPFNQDDKTERIDLNHFWINTSEYSFCLNLKLCLIRGSYDNHTYKCIYHEKSPYLAEIKNKILIRTYDKEEYKPINTEEQLYILKQAEQKQKELEDLKDKLFYPLKEYLR